MAIDPQVLQMIANPTGGKLTQIGQTYQASKQNAVDNKRAQEGHELEKMLANEKIKSIEMENKMNEVSFMGDAALSMKAHYDAGGTQENAQDVWDAVRKDGEFLGYSMPEKVPGLGEIDGLASRSKQYISYLNATKASDSAKKFQVIASLAAIPVEQRTPAQKRMFDALTSPNISINIPSPTGRTLQIGTNFLKKAKKEGTSLDGEIEGEAGYRDDVSTRAQAIQTESEKGGKAVSLSDAMSQAHEELQYKLIPTDTIKIGDWAPFGKKFIYNPEAAIPTVEPEGGLTEAQMSGVLKSNKLEDTPENRQLVNDEYAKRNSK